MGKPTIDELERLLQSEVDVPVEILPNGEIRAKGTSNNELQGKKPITMKEQLGGEYATVATRCRDGAPWTR
jgi:hypothetical protein